MDHCVENPSSIKSMRKDKGEIPLYIKVIEKNNRAVIERLIQIEEQAFGEAGLDEWGMVPFIRHGRIIALYQGEEIIGGAQFLKDWDETDRAYLYGIGIGKEYRGKGLGTWFLKACLDGLKKEGIKLVELTVDPENEPAIRVYRDKLGFRITDERKHEYGKGEHRIVMELDI